MYISAVYNEHALISFSYALFHATRKTFSNIKSLLDDSWTPSNHSQYDGLYPPEV